MNAFTSQIQTCFGGAQIHFEVEHVPGLFFRMEDQYDYPPDIPDNHLKCEVQVS
jgi:hypothetical protein